MQYQPHDAVTVQAHFEEVVASTQRAHLSDRAFPAMLDRFGQVVEAFPEGVPPVLRSMGSRSRSTGVSCRAKPTGMAASNAERSPRRLSGRRSAVRSVRTAVTPQPMSTPTAAGLTASRMAMTEPTVAPLP